MKAKFFKCEHCGNIITMVEDKGVPVVCCGEKMKELNANTTDAATEKHVPVVEVNENKVSACVGSTTHPMTEEHLIQWVYLETEQGGQLRRLTASDEPKAEFCVCEGDKPVAVYEYCNLHGLWAKEL